jgi:hypothetical protein
MLGLAGFGAASLAAAYSGDAPTLVLARIAMGAAAAVVMPLSMALVPALFDEATRPRAVTAMVAAVGLGLPLGPVVGGVLLDRFWWGSVFLVTVPVVAGSLIACVILLPRERAERPPALDVPAALAAVVATSSLVYGLIEAPSQSWTSAATLGWLALSAAASAVVFRRQRTSASPLIPPSLLAARPFTRGTLIASAVTFVLTGVLFLVPQHLQLVMGYDAMATGLRLSPFMLALVVGGLFAERSAARFPLGLLAATGLVKIAGGCAVLAWVGPDSGYLPVAVGLTVAGFGVGLVMAPVMDRVLGTLPAAAEGVGSAANNTARQLAGALGVAVLGSLSATIYADRVAGAAASLPGAAAGAVRGSLAGAQAVAAGLPGADPAEQLLTVAAAASVDGMRAAMLVCAAVSVLIAALAPVMLAVDGTSPGTPTPTRPIVNA